MPVAPFAARAGPASSAYEGGTFRVDIQLPNAYPFEPPKMKFTTKVWCVSLRRLARLKRRCAAPGAPAWLMHRGPRLPALCAGTRT